MLGEIFAATVNIYFIKKFTEDDVLKQFKQGVQWSGDSEKRQGIRLVREKSEKYQGISSQVRDLLSHKKI